MNLRPAVINIQHVSACDADTNTDRRYHKRIVIAGARLNSVSLSYWKFADRLNHEVTVLGSVEAGAVAVVSQAGVGRIEFQANVIVAVGLLALEVNKAGDGDAGLDDLEALGMVNVAIGVRRL